MLFDRRNLPVFKSRLAAIRPNSACCWGTMTPEQMLAHLRRSVEISLGEYAVKDVSNILSRTVIRWLVFHVLPWPKGKLKVPAEWIPEPEEDIETERRRLGEALERFITAAEREPNRRSINPFFGPLSLAYCRRVHGKHFDHHLRQFGA